jgi:uncharacterized repeat protein (TIGR03803 family)
MEGSDGLLYTTAYLGGLADGGTLFKLNRDGTDYSALWYFNVTGADGANDTNEYSGVIEGDDGKLYGTTSGGGDYLYGTIFKANKDGSSYEVIHSFTGGAQGSGAAESLMQASDGFLYGSTRESQSGGGTLFKIHKDGSNFAVLHSFTGGFFGRRTAKRPHGRRRRWKSLWSYRRRRDLLCGDNLQD